MGDGCASSDGRVWMWAEERLLNCCFNAFTLSWTTLISAIIET